MSKNYLDYLRFNSKEFARKNNVFDIIHYGSSSRDKEIPNDIDIAIISINNKLQENLDIAQKFKNIVKSEISNLDVKAINLSELFDKDFAARSGILTEGYSLLSSKRIAERMGFNGFKLFSYKLKSLNHNNKTKFTYALIGRKTDGIIKKLNAIQLGKGAIAVPIEKSDLFEDFLKQWKVEYKDKKVLIEK